MRPGTISPLQKPRYIWPGEPGYGSEDTMSEDDTSEDGVCDPGAEEKDAPGGVSASTGMLLFAYPIITSS